MRKREEGRTNMRRKERKTDEDKERGEGADIEKVREKRRGGREEEKEREKRSRGRKKRREKSPEGEEEKGDKKRRV